MNGRRSVLDVRNGGAVNFAAQALLPGDTFRPYPSVPFEAAFGARGKNVICLKSAWGNSP